MATEHFCLRWNNHQSTLVSVFDNLLESGTLVDCTLAADGRYLKAHKVVLSACSPYLGMLLSQHYDKHPIIILKDVKFDELKAMLDYMYRGEVNISQEQLSTFLKAAETLQIKGLTDTGAEEGIQPNRPPSSNSTTSAPTEEPLSPGSAGPNSPNPKKRKRNKPSDDPPEEKPTGSDQNASVSSLSALKNVSFGSVKREPTERDGDGDGVMSVDDSNDSAMMARPGPSNGSGNNNKGSPWILSADSGGEEMQLTPGQDGDSQDKETPEIIDLRDEAPDVKAEIKEESSTADPLYEHPLKSSKVASEELTSNTFKIISQRHEELIVPDIVEDSTIGCGENCQSSYIRVIHPDQLKELTSPLKETVQTSEGDTSTSVGSTSQSANVSGNLFGRTKTADMPGFKVIEINTTSENNQSVSHVKQYNTRSLVTQIKKAQSGNVDAVASKFRKIMPKVINSGDTDVQNNENEVAVSNLPITSTTDAQSITTTANTPNISAGQFLPFATSTVSSSSQQMQHNLGLPMQISTAAVAHTTSVLQPQWIVRPHLPAQPQPTIVLNQPTPSFTIPQPVLVAPTIIPHTDTTQHNDMCYIKTPQGYIKTLETPVMQPAVSKPTESLNKLPIPRYFLSRFPVPNQKQGTRGGSRSGGSRLGVPRSFKPVWQNQLLAQHAGRRPITPADVQRIRLNRENAEFSKINKTI